MARLPDRLALPIGLVAGHLAARAGLGLGAWALAARTLRRRHWTDRAGRVISGRVGGLQHAGIPIVGVPGLMVSSRYLVPLMAALARTHRVLTPDPPGHARSEPLGAPISVPSLATALLAWLDAVPIPRAVLVANSLGCQIALALAAHAPSRVAGLVLIGPTTDRRARSVVAQGTRLLRSIPADQRAVDLVVLRDYLSTSPRTSLRELSAMLVDRPAAIAGAVTCPTLLLRGAGDAVAPESWLQALAGLLPRAEVCTIPNAGHAAHMSNVPAVAAACRTFLRSRVADDR